MNADHYQTNRIPDALEQQKSLTFILTKTEQFLVVLKFTEFLNKTLKTVLPHFCDEIYTSFRE